MREISPDDELFVRSFQLLSFSLSEHAIARYLIRLFDGEMALTSEVNIADADRVHVEHIYPQTPKSGEKWIEHSTYVKRLGNLTLLDKRLNAQVKNSSFLVKKEKAYQDSRLEITKQLLKYEAWSPTSIDQRQNELLIMAKVMWPKKLVDDNRLSF